MFLQQNQLVYVLNYYFSSFLYQTTIISKQNNLMYNNYSVSLRGLIYKF